MNIGVNDQPQLTFANQYFEKSEELRSKRSKAREQKRREAPQDDQGDE